MRAGPGKTGRFQATLESLWRTWCSCAHRLVVEHFFQCLGWVSKYKVVERFLGRVHVLHIALEHALESFGNIVGDDISVNLAADTLLRSVSAADEDVVTLDHVVFANGDLGAE